MAANNLRILLLNYEFPPLGGGAATASAQIARQMARRGAKVVVLTSHFRGLPKREEKDGYRIYRVAAMRRNLDRCSLPEMGGFIAGAALPALRLASQFKPHLMHVFFGMPTGPVGYLVSKLTGIPYLLSLRGDDVPGRQGGALAFSHRVMRPLTRQIWARASALVVNGEGLRERAARTLPGKQIEIVPNGIDLDMFHPGYATNEAHKGVRLLFVGRLHEQKGLASLLEALTLLDPAHRQLVTLDFVGSGPDEDRLKELARTAGLASKVSFKGWLARQEIAACYQDADIFVFPSLEEGMPNVVLEAMACGKPVIASDIPGVRGLVRDGENGLLVPTSNSGTLAEALSKLITNSALREQMGKRSRTLATQYSWESTSDCYLALSERIRRQARPQPIKLDILEEG